MNFVFVAITHAVFLGAIVGLIWGFALNVKLTIGVIFGAIAGAVVGLLLGLMGKGASAGGNITDRESAFVSGNIMMLIAMVFGAIGIIVWVIRVIFF